MPEITVYEKPTCTTCRKLAALLEERGIDFERVNYHVEPLPADKIADLLRKARISPREALRTREPLYSELELAARDLPDDEIVALMAEHPELLQRPIVERGERAVLARPVELVVDFLEPPKPREDPGSSGPRAAGKP
ncbi:MAG TPA: ArsC/Spx/MgsR family protein [Thermoleophilaceae bacterium]|nr:ArsC/Spx/MgsR family protein [Thermoleophilaceae bacterium]